MASKRYKEIVRGVLENFKQFAPMYAGDWRVTETRYGVKMKNTVLTPNGPAVFYLFFRWDEALCGFKLHLVGKRSAYLNKLHDFRGSLEAKVGDALVLACISKGAQAILKDDPGV